MTPPVSKRPHPTLSDVALALATKPATTYGVEVEVTDNNQKGETRVSVKAHFPTYEDAQKAADVYDVLRARYPREEAK